MLKLSEFVYEVGDILLDNIIVTKNYREKNIKMCDYRCLKCGHEGKIREHLIKKSKYICPVCSNRKVVKGINDIATTHPEYVKYFVNENDAYIYSKGSGNRVLTKCPNCNHERMYKISDLTYFKKYSCPKCGDGISYPEKYMFNMLEQLNIHFETQKKFEWSENKYYDFYIPNLNLIIETHGSQHYKDKNSLYNISNDKLKEFLANSNKITEYIIVNCSISNSEFIRNNILNSKLGRIFNLDNIAWNECDEYASKTSNLIKACNLFNEGLNVKTISIDLKLSTESIRRYLYRGNELNLCKYEGEKEKIKNWENNRKAHSKNKKISLIKDGEVLGVFCNNKALLKYVKDTYDIFLEGTHVAKMCREGKGYKGFYFKYE